MSSPQFEARQVTRSEGNVFAIKACFVLYVATDRPGAFIGKSLTFENVDLMEDLLLQLPQRIKSSHTCMRTSLYSHVMFAAEPRVRRLPAFQWHRAAMGIRDAVVDHDPSSCHDSFTVADATDEEKQQLTKSTCRACYLLSAHSDAEIAISCVLMHAVSLHTVSIVSTGYTKYVCTRATVQMNLHSI